MENAWKMSLTFACVVRLYSTAEQLQQSTHVLSKLAWMSLTAFYVFLTCKSLLCHMRQPQIVACLILKQEKMV